MMHMLAWAPFLDPIPIWSNAIWPWMLIPMAAAISIVYKSVKCRSMSQVPREATEIFLTIIFGMIAAAVILAGVVQVMEWAAR
jgi:hypothetical protein